jgi:hypothetical protein
MVAYGDADEVLTRSSIEQHYGARVRVLPVLAAGRAVVPVREERAAASDEEV